MRRARLAAVALLGAVVAACGESGPAGTPLVLVDPLLDSLFVGDTLAPRAVTYLDAAGDTQPTGPVVWTSSDTGVATVNAAGQIVGTGGGFAILSARANGTTGTALLVVSRPLDVAILLDTIYLMPGDTFTVPVSVRVKGGGGATLWFRTPANPYFTVDSATGRDTAKVAGPGQRFYAFAATAGDTALDSAVTEVVQLSDTVGGKAYFTVFGTAIRHARAGARAVNYRRQGDTMTFRVTTPILGAQSATVETVVITLRDSVNGPGSFSLDSISRTEAFGAGSDFICRPLRPWALWSTQAFFPPVVALSRPGGTITLGQLVPVTHGRAVSGRFEFTGQRTDFYDDPFGAVAVRGTFVAPLIADSSRRCG